HFMSAMWILTRIGPIKGGTIIGSKLPEFPTAFNNYTFSMKFELPMTTSGGVFHEMNSCTIDDQRILSCIAPDLSPLISLSVLPTNIPIALFIDNVFAIQVSPHYTIYGKSFILNGKL